MQGTIRLFMPPLSNGSYHALVGGAGTALPVGGAVVVVVIVCAVARVNVSVAPPSRGRCGSLMGGLLAFLVSHLDLGGTSSTRLDGHQLVVTQLPCAGTF